MADYLQYFDEHWALLQQANAWSPRPNPTFANTDFTQADFRVLIARLSPFRDVDRSTPHLFLYQATRRAIPGAYIDMAFFPLHHDRERFLRDGIPLLVGTQSGHDATDFDVILVSNAYTLELVNLPYLLHNSGLPMYASQRREFPPIILGGSNALATQSVITPEGDAMVDAVFFGEGEHQVEVMLHSLHQNKALPKAAGLTQAAELTDGLWLANVSGEQDVTKAVCDLPDGDDLLTSYPLLNSGEADTTRLQINYGCPAFCSFCFEGYDRKPYREVGLDVLMQALRTIKLEQGAHAVDMYSFNFNTHADILPMLVAMNKLMHTVSFKSQRVDVLAAMPDLLETEISGGKHSFTVGVEGISARMRTYLHKSLSNAAILSPIARLFRHSVREIKLFYILTGHESDEDIAEFRDFIREIKAYRQDARGRTRVVFSFGLLIRMPFTPLRYDRLFLDEREWRPIIGAVKSACETNGFEFRLAVDWDDYAATQILALGGHWLHEPVAALAREGHFYDMQLTPGYWDMLHAWMVAHDQWSDDLLEEKPETYQFALNNVKHRIDLQYLYKQYQSLMRGEDDGYCLGEFGHLSTEDDNAHCLLCNACVLPEQRHANVQHRMAHPGSMALKDFAKMMKDKQRIKPVYARVWLPTDSAGTDPAWRNAWILRAMLQAVPDQVENVLAVREVLFDTKAIAPRFSQLHGETVVAITAWDVPALGRALSVLTGTELPGGVRFEGFLDGYDAQSVRKLHLTVRLPVKHFPQAAQTLRAYLQSQYVPVNLRRQGEGFVFDISAKAKKKRVIFKGTCAERNGAFEANLVVSLKFDLMGWFRSFDGPDRHREAHIEVTRIEGEGR